MADVDEIIVLDDDDDEEEPPHPSEANKSPRKPSPQSNGKKEGGSNQTKAAKLSAENKKLFEEFVNYCSKLTSEHPEVISFLQGRYSKANPVYLTSVEFRNTLGRCLTRVQSKRSKIFVYINELCTALKANTQKRKLVLQMQAPQQPAVKEAVSVNEKEGEKQEAPERKTGSRRQIRYLETLLRIYSQEIQKLQEKELSLDDLEDEDSSYIQEARLKRKLLRIFEKLCELKACPSLTGRVIEQRILYRGTRYPEVNRRLEKFINSSRDIFPDYGDVLRVVQKANDKHGLGLSNKQMQSMAQDAFRELGNKLQDRRHLDMVYNFGCHLTDSYKHVNDPAHQDPPLSRRLRENRNMALSHLEDIIKKYAEMQDDGEEEDRKKRRKDSEMPSTSKDEKMSLRSKQTASSDASEEEEESEDSDTDIEDELQKCQKIAEDGEDEEEDVPGDQETEADQNMDASSDPQIFSSGGEEDVEKEEADDEDGDKDIVEEVEEATEQESSPASTSLSHDKESQNTSLESEVEVLPSGSPDLPTWDNDTPTSAKTDDEHSREQEDCANTSTTSDEANDGDQLEVQPESTGLAQDTVESGEKDEKENEETDVLLECKSPTGVEEDTGKPMEVENNLLPDISDSLIEKNDKDDVEPGAEDVTEVTDDPSHGASGDERTVAETEESSHSAISEDTEEPYVESPTRIDTEEQSSNEACTISRKELASIATNVNDDYDDEVDATVRSSQRPSSSDVELCANITQVGTDTLDLDSCDNNPSCDLSPLGNSNGVHADTQEQNTAVHRLKRNRDKAAHRDSIKPRKSQEDTPPCRKRRRNLSQTWTENGVTKYNGSEQGDDQTTRNCKRAKTECSYTSLSSSSDSESDNEHDITLDLMVTCSPPETSPKKSDQCNKSHASTQCDPDEVIVLSD